MGLAKAGDGLVVWDIPRGHNSFNTGQFLCPVSVNGKDLCGRVLTPQNLSVEHPRDSIVVCVFCLPKHFVTSIMARHGLPDDLITSRSWFTDELHIRHDPVLLRPLRTFKCNILDRINDLLIPGAAAEISRDRLSNLLPARSRISIEKRLGRHNHS